MSIEDIIVKASFLGSHSDLFQVYKALVDTNLMADAEFWRIRQDELDIERISFRNRKGVPVQTPNRYALSTCLKEQLLESLPQLRNLVRLSNDEGKLWEEFFSSRTHGDGSKASPIFDPQVMRESEAGLGDAEYIMRKLKSLAASEYDRFEGFGNREGEYFEEPKITCTLMHEINLQSVQQVPPLGNLRDIQASHTDIVIPDLTKDLYDDEVKAEPSAEVKKELYLGPLYTVIPTDSIDSDPPNVLPLPSIPSDKLIIKCCR